MAKSVKTVASRFLKIRPRSVAELKEKLEVKGFSLDEIESTIHDLLASRLLDDRAFTKSWINYRLARPFGFRRIIQELKAKGIDQEIIAQAIAKAQGNVSMENTVLELAQRRWQKLPVIDVEKKKKRVLDFLLRRGFDADVAIKTVSVIARSEATKQS